MGILHKEINVSLKNYDPLVVITLSVNGTTISKMPCVLEQTDTLLISDIKPFAKKKDYCKGYGSMIMNRLFEYALDNGIHTIYGNLSLIDKDHSERLHHFYAKHGFEIVIFNEPEDVYYGKALKKL